MFRFITTLSLCSEELLNHMELRCRLGLTVTTINNTRYKNRAQVKEFVDNLMHGIMSRSDMFEKQVKSLLLYSDDIKKKNLALRILSINADNYIVFILLIHILNIIDVTNMERSGNFYNFVVRNITNIIYNTVDREIEMEYSELATIPREYMNVFNDDFSHFLSLFSN